MIELLLLIFRADMHVMACRSTSYSAVSRQRKPGMVYRSLLSGGMTKIRTVAVLANFVKIIFQLFLGRNEDEPTPKFFCWRDVTD